MDDSVHEAFPEENQAVVYPLLIPGDGNRTIWGYVSVSKDMFHEVCLINNGDITVKIPDTEFDQLPFQQCQRMNSGDPDMLILGTGIASWKFFPICRSRDGTVWIFNGPASLGNNLIVKKMTVMNWRLEVLFRKRAGPGGLRFNARCCESNQMVSLHGGWHFEDDQRVYPRGVMKAILEETIHLISPNVILKLVDKNGDKLTQNAPLWDPQMKSRVTQQRLCSPTHPATIALMQKLNQFW